MLSLQRSVGNRAVTRLLTEERVRDKASACPAVGAVQRQARSAPVVQRLVGEKSVDPQHLLTEAAAAFKAGDIPGAKGIFRQLASLPGLPDALRTTVLLNLATCYQREADFLKAIDIYMEALSGPGLDDKLRRFGLERIRQCRLRVTENAAADAQVVKSTGVGGALSDYAQKRLKHAELVLKAGNLPGAKAIFRNLAALPGLPDAVRSVVLLNLATCYQREADFLKAIDIYMEALSGPGLDDKFRRFGLERIRQCRLRVTENAAADSQATEGGGAGGALSGYAQKQLKHAQEVFASGDIPGALAIFRKLAGVPGLPDMVRTMVLFNLATCHQREADFLKAIQIYMEAVRGPGVKDDLRRTALERIRQCRLKMTGGSDGGAKKQAPELTRVLAWGSKGNDVAHLQERLTAAGFALTADGQFFNVTYKAVRQFQKSRGLKLDGKVGKTTWAALHA